MTLLIYSPNLYSKIIKHNILKYKNIINKKLDIDI